MNKERIEEKIVVLLTPSIYHHKDSGVRAARFEKLGLTAYGHSEDEALQSLKKLFNKFVRTYRASGQLGERLDQVSVEWHLAKDFEGDYEDTSESQRGHTFEPQRSWTPVRDTEPVLPVAA